MVVVVVVVVVLVVVAILFCDPMLLKAMMHSTKAQSSRQLYQPGKDDMTKKFHCFFLKIMNYPKRRSERICLMTMCHRGFLFGFGWLVWFGRYFQTNQCKHQKL